VVLDGLTVSVILSSMVVLPFVFYLLFAYNFERLHRLLFIYTLFDYTSRCTRSQRVSLHFVGRNLNNPILDPMQGKY
ncbi:MAG: hypothetical protein LLG40_13510, partial [Deltaproteobacteria bacterium]|nr:hypothetical protein [Deltaproteobacteria bacterium]